MELRFRTFTHQNLIEFTETLYDAFEDNDEALFNKALEKVEFFTKVMKQDMEENKQQRQELKLGREVYVKRSPRMPKSNLP